MPGMLTAAELADMRSLLFTYTVTVQRRSGAAVYANRQTHIEWPDAKEVLQPEGPEVAAVLTDLPDSTYVLGDIITITAVDGQTTGLPQPTKYSAGEVQRISNPWPGTKVQLTGTNRKGSV
jgi:hypothetical protein